MTLTGGLTVTVAALQLLWTLEDRRFDVQVDGNLLLVRPKAKLTPDDDRAIRAHQAELVTLVRYCEPIQ